MNEKAEELDWNMRFYKCDRFGRYNGDVSSLTWLSFARIVLTEHPEFLGLFEFTGIQVRERDKAPMINFNYMLGTNAAMRSLKP